MINQKANEIMDRWCRENTPGINPKNTAVLFYVSFKYVGETQWHEFDGGRVTILEEAERIAAVDGRMWSLRKVHIGDTIISVWSMKESRDTIECIYRDEELYAIYAGKDYSEVWK